MLNFVFLMLGYLLFVFLFCREVRLDHRRFLERKRKDNERLVADMERYVSQRLAEGSGKDVEVQRD